MKAKRLMAVDLGASGGKCFSGMFADGAFSMRETHRFAHEGVSFFAADDSGKVTERTYWDDIYLYHNIIKALQNHRRDVADTLDSIGIDTWGADGQFVQENGDIAGKVYSYRDHRLDNMIAAVKQRIDAEKIYRITGIHFQPFNVSNQLYWFMRNRRKTIRPGAVYLPISTLFYYYLCGCRKVDSTLASVTQLMDAHTNKWSEEILEKLEIPLEVMPEIVLPGTVVGELYQEIAAMVGINRAKMIAVGSHDTASAFAAAPVDNTDEAMIISSGTWSLVGKLVPKPLTDAKAMRENFSNEGGIGNIRLLKNCMGTWIAQELIKLWNIEDGKKVSWGELDRLTQSAPALKTFIDPDYPGFYNPANMQQAINEFCVKSGQQPPASRGDCLRTVYESLALKYREIRDLLNEITGQDCKVCNIVGGGTKNLMLNQFTANALNLPVKAGPEESSAVGNFMVQALGLGVISSMHEALGYIRATFPIREYQSQD
ncbi:MAG: FGGY family carbohydrate kinase, partial [Victivallales bacterium]|nr:FGGY family carbohydrate kinase [Victivallales bacterium]